MEQVKALHRMLLTHPEHWGKVRLVLIGSIRNSRDAARREAVRQFAADRGLLAAGAVEIPEHVDAEQKKQLLRQASVGLHAMVDEHFGICVVEYMAAGAVPLAHNSAGPQMDIVVPALTREDMAQHPEPEFLGGEAVGCLANDEEDYAECLHMLLTRTELRHALSARARVKAAAFSKEAFSQQFLTAFAPYLQ